MEAAPTPALDFASLHIHWQEPFTTCQTAWNSSSEFLRPGYPGHEFNEAFFKVSRAVMAASVGYRRSVADRQKDLHTGFVGEIWTDLVNQREKCPRRLREVIDETIIPTLQAFRRERVEPLLEPLDPVKDGRVFRSWWRAAAAQVLAEVTCTVERCGGDRSVLEFLTGWCTSIDQAIAQNDASLLELAVCQQTLNKMFEDAVCASQQNTEMDRTCRRFLLPLIETILDAYKVSGGSVPGLLAVTPRPVSEAQSTLNAHFDNKLRELYQVSIRPIADEDLYEGDSAVAMDVDDEGH
jgi:hypothetical protein